MKPIKFLELLEEERKRVTILEADTKKKEDVDKDEEEDGRVFKDEIYDRLKDKKLNWAQLSNDVDGYSANNATSRSLFNKKAHQWTDQNGYKYAFNKEEIRQIKNSLGEN